MSQPRPRRLTAAILVVALSMLVPAMSLALPGGGPVPASRSAWSSGPGLLDLLFDLLSPLWVAKNGGQLDPSGSSGEGRGGFDPNGSPTENGGQLDPDGRPAPGDNGSQLDPDGVR